MGWGCFVRLMFGFHALATGCSVARLSAETPVFLWAIVRGKKPNDSPASLKEPAQGWNKAKRALAFARVSQDGDDEGILILDRLPTKTEAEAIRHHLGVAKRKEIGPEQLKTLQERARGWSKNPLAALAG
jgi:hypothetical protein